MNKDKVEEGIKMMLEGLGVDLNGSHFKDTPKRATRAWTNELCSGLGEQSFELTTFDIEPDYEPSMVVLHRGHQTASCHCGECSHLETNEAEPSALAHNGDCIDATSHDAA